jgi:hypothetical protein
MKDGAGIQQFACQFALFGRALDGRKQRRQRRPVFCPDVFLQRPAQWHMLHLALLGNPIRVGRQKAKRIRPIALILREMKRGAPHRVPRRIAFLQVRGGAARRPADGRVNMGVQLIP